MTQEKFNRLLSIYGDYWNSRGRDPETWGLSVVMAVGSSNHRNSRIIMEAQYCNAEGHTTDLTVLHEFFDRFASPDPLRHVTAKKIDTRSSGVPGLTRRWLGATPAELVEPNTSRHI